MCVWLTTLTKSCQVFHWEHLLAFGEGNSFQQSYDNNHCSDQLPANSNPPPPIHVTRTHPHSGRDPNVTRSLRRRLQMTWKKEEGEESKIVITKCAKHMCPHDIGLGWMGDAQGQSNSAYLRRPDLGKRGGGGPGEGGREGEKQNSSDH